MVCLVERCWRSRPAMKIPRLGPSTWYRVELATLVSIRHVSKAWLSQWLGSPTVWTMLSYVGGNASWRLHQGIHIMNMKYGYDLPNILLHAAIIVILSHSIALTPCYTWACSEGFERSSLTFNSIFPAWSSNRFPRIQTRMWVFPITDNAILLSK